MKFAYFVRPHIGGTYTVFRQLRAALAEKDIDVRWLGMASYGVPCDAQWLPEFSYGSLVETPNGASERDQAEALAQALEEGQFDGIFINVLSDRIQTNIARYLPDRFLRIMIVHNITAGTYSAAGAIRDHVHATVGVSDRICSDLVRKLGFPADRTFAIPHAAGTSAVRQFKREPSPDDILRVIFLGRVEDASKGVLWLPDIFAHLPQSIHLTIAGDGPDLERLKSRMAPHQRQAAFLGAVHPEAVFDLLLRHDVLIMPSRFEGFGLTITEAMSAGCIPVVSRIRGVTDTIVDDGTNGFLFTIGNVREAAEIIGQIHSSPQTAHWMSDAARCKADGTFTIGNMAERYDGVIRQITAHRPAIAPSLRIKDWAMPKGLRPGLRTFVPRPVKNWLRMMRERI
ncbi:glycosyltransferase family 4 protein [Phyllobacterium myrsinacearum]|jgi:glycosyltransferase involved in cell wall biosynthesis|uniref:Glycosyltransferase family 1 protein n=1 Tax=Phyllobacterium myrsinacearum TaxID=28101 RepID=A0A2S9JFP3_9HYPH|nr:glycosyltransferase family 4 protein [Phyllobacterium myrsinacearum]PRD51741.1 glycosyltransferase family 1 protein [Phyllobacterium myrsinacearum]PWV86301.1 glycosyltransferase involved in cell wall biosynthesis [Phyllobacterium myrsinacearum]RZV00026.1 glycosyltransferase involved in cell wall biosynthesis [Phyllobacterium myrsinacearum]